MSTIQDGGSETVHLPALQQLTVTATLGAGRVRRLSDSVGGPSQGLTAVPAGESVVVGPYAYPTRFRVEARDGALNYSVGVVALATAAQATEKFVSVSGDLAELSGAGAPDASVQASLDVNPTGDDNSLTFTAVTAGATGNDISVAYLDPGEADAALSVVVYNKAIQVNLETDSEGAIVSTAADVLAAIEASAEASALVGVAIDTGDTGSGDDGSGVVTAMAAANLDNGAGVGAGSAGIGSRYTDTTNGAIYLNTGTKAVPTWSALAEA